MIYLLHFQPAYRHAKHYLGFTENLDQRLKTHTGPSHGSPLVKAAISAGSIVALAKVWSDGTRTQERSKKNHGKARSCPVCQGKYGPYKLLTGRTP